MANNITVNYDDKRFGQVESDKKQAMTELEQTYGGMVKDTDNFYQAQIDASKQWADKQTQLQQEQTDFTIEQIEQQKDQSHKDYLKEQSGAYVDWQKQSNQYGAQAEQMAAQGMQNTGFSESSQVGMYNAYQNRVAVARDSYNRAVLNYDNAIKDARLQNNAALAEIAFEALKNQLELSLQGFQYKNQLILDKTNQKIQLDQMYHDRYQDVLAQINHENAVAEQIRQFNLEYNEGIRQFNEEIARHKKKDEQEYKMQIEELELKKKQLEEEKRQFDTQMALKSSSSSGGGGGGSSSKSSISKNTKSGNSSSGSYHGVDRNTSSQLNGSKMTVVNSPLTPEGAAERVARGELNAKVEGNKIYVSSNPNYVKGQGTLNKYTSLLKIK